jgi:hypothetical protein
MMLAPMTTLAGIALALIAATAVVFVIDADGISDLAYSPIIRVIATVVGLLTVGLFYSVRRDFKRQREEERLTLRDEMEEAKQEESERNR